MFDKKLHLKNFLNVIFSLFLTFIAFCAVSQNSLTDTANSIINVDSLQQIVSTDTIQVADSTAKKKKSSREKTVIEHKIDRSAADSIVQDLKEKKVYLFGKAVVTYGDIKIEAEYLEFDMSKNTVYAAGKRDSTGKLFGTPVFTEDGQTFEAEEMEYNFESKKGLISKVFTEDGSGYLHGTRVKKMTDNSINIRSGAYTTCNLKEDPHFEFRFNKSKVIPDNKIVTGPAYMAIEGVPTPLALPFGLFPNKKGQKSGIVIPTYGESNSRGFYFENGGYYWAINEYMDLKLVGDIYTRGSWAVKPLFRYVKRYKFNGSFNASYATNIIGTQGSSDYKKSNDFQIRWTHAQDAKARPAGRFSADVYIVSSNYNTYNSTSAQNYLSNEFKSSIAYQTNWDNKYFLTLNAGHRQNTLTKIVNITLPELTFSVNQFFPFQKKNNMGKKKWYENLNVSYTTNAKNYLSLPDSLLFKKGWENSLQNGIKHSIPINLPIKVLKYFTLSNSINVTDRMYFDYRDKYWSNDTLVSGSDTIVGYLVSDTIHKFKNAVDFSLSTRLSTKLYGMVNFKKGPIRAIRHVLTPQVTFTYTPDFGSEFWNYYDSYVDQHGVEQVYSKFEGSLFGTPSNGKSGRISFSLSNNLEIKVPSKKDTITGLKKVILIKDLSLSGSYDVAKDSMNFSYLSISGNTVLFKKLNVTYSSSWDPYAVDSLGKPMNQYNWDVNHKLFRKTATTWNFGLSWRISQSDFKKKDKNASTAPNQAKTSDFGTEAELSEINSNPDDYVDWSTPWSLSFNYNFRYSNSPIYFGYLVTNNKKTIQTLGFSGEVNVTKKWKITFTSGWDFETKKLSYTSFNIYRDLHCWEIRFNWIPIGARKSWNFTINVKASVLQDLKLSKKKDFRDI